MPDSNSSRESASDSPGKSWGVDSTVATTHMVFLP